MLGLFVFGFVFGVAVGASVAVVPTWFRRRKWTRAFVAASEQRQRYYR